MTTTSFYNFLFSIAIIFSAESVSAKKVDVPFYRKSEKLVVSYDEFRRMRPVKQEQWIKAVQDFYVNLEKIEKGERVGYVAIEFQPIDSFAWLTVKALVPKICTTAELLLGTSKAYALTPSELPQQKVDAALAESRKAEAARKKLIELNAQLKKEGDKLNYAICVS